MSISEELAEKLLVIANNIVTESEAVERQTELLQQVRTALVGKTVPGDPGDSGSYDEGYADGKQAEYDTFWDAYQENGNRANYQRGFYMWTGAAFNPKYGINGTLLEAFFTSTITSVKVPIVTGSNSAQSAFHKCSNLVSIESIDITGVTNTQNMFYSCTALEEIRFAGEIASSLSFAQSPNLSADSVQSIIDHLKDLTGQTKQTITFHKDMESKVTHDQKQAIFAKNWEQVY